MCVSVSRASENDTLPGRLGTLYSLNLCPNFELHHSLRNGEDASAKRGKFDTNKKFLMTPLFVNVSKAQKL